MKFCSERTRFCDEKVDDFDKIILRFSLRSFWKIKLYQTLAKFSEEPMLKFNYSIIIQLH